MYPEHVPSRFCRCFCCTGRLNLGVFHQPSRLNLGVFIKKRRHSGQMSLKMTGVVGQSDALIYSHPIDHSNDRYRERFFSSRNGFGKKNISGATKVYIFLANERACFVSRPNGEHKNPIFLTLLLTFHHQK